MQQSQSRNDEPDAMFRSVAEVARMCGVSKMTVYRAIAAGEFPAVRIQGRLIVPAGAIEAMAKAAMTARATIDAADWTAKAAPSQEGDRLPIGAAERRLRLDEQER